jgi:hypothetical protein
MCPGSTPGTMTDCTVFVVFTMVWLLAIGRPEIIGVK